MSRVSGESRDLTSARGRQMRARPGTSAGQRLLRSLAQCVTPRNRRAADRPHSSRWRLVAAGAAGIVAFGAVAVVGEGIAAAASSVPLTISGREPEWIEHRVTGANARRRLGATRSMVTGCLEETSQSVSIQIYDDNGWVAGPGGRRTWATSSAPSCYSANLPAWSWFGCDGFYAKFGGNSNYTAQTSGTVYVSMGSNLSWASVPGGTYSYGQGVSSGISANYAANSIGYSYSGSLPSGVGWTGGGFSGTADQVGGFGGTVYATEYGSNGTSEQISAGYGLTVNAVGPSWTSAPSARTVTAGQGGWSRHVLGEWRTLSVDRHLGWVASCWCVDEQRSPSRARQASGPEAFTTSPSTHRTPAGRSTRTTCSPSMSHRRSRAPTRPLLTSGTLAPTRSRAPGRRTRRPQCAETGALPSGVTFVDNGNWDRHAVGHACAKQRRCVRPHDHVVEHHRYDDPVVRALRRPGASRSRAPTRRRSRTTKAGASTSPPRVTRTSRARRPVLLPRWRDVRTERGARRNADAVRDVSTSTSIAQTGTAPTPRRRSRLSSTHRRRSRAGAARRSRPARAAASRCPRSATHPHRSLSQVRSHRASRSSTTATGRRPFAGTPSASAGGSYTFNIIASNTVANTTHSFTLTVDAAPVFTSPNTMSVNAGAAFSETVTTADGYPVPTMATTTTLPSGVTLRR